MFIKSKQYDQAIRKVTINVGKLFGLETDEEAFITMKELPTMEIMKLKTAVSEGEEASFKCMKEMFPQIITDHNFYMEEGKKMSNKDLIDLVFEKFSVTQEVVSKYTAAVFPVPKRGGEDTSDNAGEDGVPGEVQS